MLTTALLRSYCSTQVRMIHRFRISCCTICYCCVTHEWLYNSFNTLASEYYHIVVLSESFTVIMACPSGKMPGKALKYEISRLRYGNRYARRIYGKSRYSRLILPEEHALFSSDPPRGIICLRTSDSQQGEGGSSIPSPLGISSAFLPIIELSGHILYDSISDTTS